MLLTEKDQLFKKLLKLCRGFNLYTSAHFSVLVNYTLEKLLLRR